MSLSAFIADHEESIVGEFAAFARTLMPPEVDMTEAELRDHAEDMLAAVVADMRLAQTDEEQADKSQGHGAVRSMASSGRLHADDRIQHGFSFRSVLAEFRALRATVLRLYAASGALDLAEVSRFNEAVDEALTESMERFAVGTDLFRDQFVGILGHDLRTPLGAITTAAALLATPEDYPERRARVVARIMSSALRMERLVADLLELTRVRLGGSMPLHRRQTDLDRLAGDAIGEIRAGHPDVVVRLTAHGDVRGEWDPDRLSQVLANLIGNAITHGSRTPVEVTVTGASETVTLAVHNGGAPIPPDALPSIFEPLARVAERRGDQGIGLGLFIARTIVAAHQGTLDVTSSADQGTTFSARLPRKASADAGTSERVPPVARAAGSGGSAGRIGPRRD